MDPWRPYWASTGSTSAAQDAPLLTDRVPARNGRRRSPISRRCSVSWPLEGERRRSPLICWALCCCGRTVSCSVCCERAAFRCSARFDCPASISPRARAVVSSGISLTIKFRSVPLSYMPQEPSKQKYLLSGAGCGRFFRSLERQSRHAWEVYGGVYAIQSPNLVDWDMRKDSRQLSSYQMSHVLQNIQNHWQILIHFSSFATLILRLLLRQFWHE